MNTVTINKLRDYYLMVSELLQIGGVVSTDSNNRKVIYLNKKKNNFIYKLKNILSTSGCFNFFSTNSGENIIGVSQIIYFLSSGYKAHKRGYVVNGNIHEVHHLNGNVQDNSPDNLILLSAFDHHIVTNCQKASVKFLADLDLYTLNLSSNWESECNNKIATPFNNQGKSIRDHKHFLCNIIAKTILSTSQSEWLKKAINKDISIYEINKFVEKYNPDKYSSFYKDEQNYLSFLD